MSRRADEAIKKWLAYFSAYAAEPGALVMGPLEAAMGGADATPTCLGPPEGGYERHRFN
jgi:hypothetical protein